MRMRGPEDDIDRGGDVGCGRDSTETTTTARSMTGRNVALFHVPKNDQLSTNTTATSNTTTSTTSTSTAGTTAPAGLVLKTGDSRWSDALDVGGMAHNSKGDVTVIGSRWMPELGFASTRVAGSPGMPTRRKATNTTTAPVSPSSPADPPQSTPGPTSATATTTTSSIAPTVANQGTDSSSSLPLPTPLYELAWHVKSASGAFGRTRVVTLQDRFVLSNQSKRRILRVNQMGGDNISGLNGDATSSSVGAISPLVLLPGASAPFHWSCAAHKRLLVVSFVDNNSNNDSRDGSYSPQVESSWEWSGGIDPSAVGTYSVFVRPSMHIKRRGKGGEKDLNPRTLRVSVSTTSGEEVGADGRGGSNEGAGGGSGALEIVFQEEEEEEGKRIEQDSVKLADEEKTASTNDPDKDKASAGIESKKELPRASAQSASPRLPALVRAENLTGWGVYFAQVGVSLLPHPHAQSTSFPFQRAPKPLRVPPNAPGGNGEPGPSHPQQLQPLQGGGRGARSNPAGAAAAAASTVGGASTTAAAMATATAAIWPCDVLLPHSTRSVAWDKPCPPPSKRQTCLALRLSLAPLANASPSPNEGCLNLTVGGSATLPAVSCVTHSGAPLVVGPVLVVVMSEGPSTVLRFLPSAPPPRLLAPSTLSSANLAAAALGAFDPSPSFAAKTQQEAAARAAARAATAASNASALADATTAANTAAAAANASLGVNGSGKVAVRGRQIQCRAYLKSVQVSLVAHGGEGSQLSREVPPFGACRGLGSRQTSGNGSSSGGGSGGSSGGSSGLVPRELLVLCGQDLSLDWEPSMYAGGATKIDLNLSAVQIDNHLPQAPFPVLLLANPSLLREDGSSSSSSSSTGSSSSTRTSAPPAISVAVSLLPRGPHLLHVRRLDVEVGSRVHLGLDDGTVAALQVRVKGGCGGENNRNHSRCRCVSC